MANIINLRRNPRCDGEYFVALFEDELVGIVDISAAGIRIKRPYRWDGERNIYLYIMHAVDDSPDHQRAVRVCGHVVGVEESQLRILFAAASPELANVISSYAQATAPLRILEVDFVP